ncbi:MAG: hypothetical protein JST87_16465 [Bacteroidetes bacterium]|nr:hypothetical protein [Bacteroidota bacterium]MBS1933004.1 hypothetical protein [Bacteroidota bacterium]
MTDEELKNIWKEYDHKLEEAKLLNLQSWALNLRSLEMMQTEKTKSKLNALARFKIFAVVLGVLYVLLLGLLVVANHFRNIYFSVSISMIMLFTIISIITYIYHIVLIHKINYSESITQTQERITILQTSTVNIMRIIWLQLPFHTTWFWSNRMINFNSWQGWLIPFVITFLFVLATIWLYRNIDLKNINKKWFKILFSSTEWTSLEKAKNFLSEIDDFKKEIA